MTEVLSRYEITENRPRLFAVEGDDGRRVKVAMHPKCYIDLCVNGYKAVCLPCLRQLGTAFNAKSE